MRRKLACFLAVFILVPSLLLAFSSCAGMGPAVFTCGLASIDEATYRYWFINLKAGYVASYSDITDTEACWNMLVPGQDKTYAEFVDEKIKDQIDHYLAGVALFLEYDMTLPESTKDAIDIEIEDTVEYQYNGSRRAYDDFLEERYGFDSKKLRKIRLLEEEFYYAYNTLYGENGRFAATSDEIAAFYSEKYARIKYYMVRRHDDYVYDKAGNRVVLADGSYQLRELNEEEKKEREKAANDALADIQKGTKTIDDYIAKDYPELLEAYPNGFYLLQNETYLQMYGATLINGAFAMKENEIAFLENEDAFFIVERLPLPENGYLGADSGQFSNLASYASAEKAALAFDELIKGIVPSEDFEDNYSVKTVK